MCAPAEIWVIRLPAAMTFTGRVTGALAGAMSSWPALSSPSPRPSRRCRGRGELALAEMPAMRTPGARSPLGGGVAGRRAVAELPVVVVAPRPTEVTAEMALVSVARGVRAREMPVTWARPAILTGTGLSAVAPLPSWPNRLAPQANTMPSERSARAKSRPAEISVTRFSTATRAGATSSLLIVPRPSWPGRCAPGPHRAVGPQGQAELAAGRHLDDSGQALHLDRREPVGGGAVAQLARAVEPPGRDGAVGPQG